MGESGGRVTASVKLSVSRLQKGRVDRSVSILANWRRRVQSAPDSCCAHGSSFQIPAIQNAALPLSGVARLVSTLGKPESRPNVSLRGKDLTARVNSGLKTGAWVDVVEETDVNETQDDNGQAFKCSYTLAPWPIDCD